MNKPSEMQKDTDSEEAFLKRYGKRANVFRTVDLNDDKTFKQVTLRFETPSGKHYVLTEVYKGNTNLTDYVLLCYTKDNRTLEHKFNRFLDAEVTLADRIAEEEDGDVK